MSQTGVLVYSAGGSDEVQLTWFDRNGKAVGVVGQPGQIRNPSIAPDGNTVAFVGSGERGGVWLHDLIRGAISRLDSGVQSNSPVWSPGSQTLAVSDRSRHRVTLNPIGAGKEEVVWTGTTGGGTGTNSVGAEG